MRTMVAVALAMLMGCGAAEPISETTSPAGCWNSISGHAELDLRAGGAMQFLDGDNARIVSGSWSYDAAHGSLLLSTEPTPWLVTDLTPSEMWTATEIATHWQSVACE